jgi:hypothetical protein
MREFRDCKESAEMELVNSRHTRAKNKNEQYVIEKRHTSITHGKKEERRIKRNKRRTLIFLVIVDEHGERKWPRRIDRIDLGKGKLELGICAHMDRGRYAAYIHLQQAY